MILKLPIQQETLNNQINQFQMEQTSEIEASQIKLFESFFDMSTFFKKISYFQWFFY